MNLYIKTTNITIDLRKMSVGPEWRKMAKLQENKMLVESEYCNQKLTDTCKCYNTGIYKLILSW